MREGGGGVLLITLGKGHKLDVVEIDALHKRVIWINMIGPLKVINLHKIN